MKHNASVPRAGILAGGSWEANQFKEIDGILQADQFIPIRECKEEPGGAPHNVLAALAKLGAPFPLWGAGCIGKDAPGQVLLDQCRQHKIDTRYLRATPAAPTAYTEVMTERPGSRRTLFHYPGANALWRGTDLNFTKIKARFFHLGSLFSLGRLIEPDKKHGTQAASLLAAAQGAGLKTSLDILNEASGSFVSLVSPALKFADYCLLNEIEAGQITGFKIRQPNGQLDPVALRHAAGALLQKGVRELVVIHYPEGAFARTRKGEDAWQPAVNVPAGKVVGVTGVRDAFCAGVLLGLHEGWDLPRCLLTGVCVAAACLGGLSSTGGIKPLEAVLALARKYKFHPPLEPAE